jgi:hypothetical protein
VADNMRLEEVRCSKCYKGLFMAGNCCPHLERLKGGVIRSADGRRHDAIFMYRAKRSVEPEHTEADRG